MTIKEKQACRRKLIKRLKAIRKEAYYGVTCVEYDAISVAIHLMECFSKEDERRMKDE